MAGRYCYPDGGSLMLIPVEDAAAEIVQLLESSQWLGAPTPTTVPAVMVAHSDLMHWVQLSPVMRTCTMARVGVEAWNKLLDMMPRKCVKIS